MSPPLRASNEGLLSRALREHRGLTGHPPLLADFFSILLGAAAFRTQVGSSAASFLAVKGRVVRTAAGANSK